MATQPWPPLPNNKLKWYKQPWFTVLTLILFFPIGIILMWAYQKKWNAIVKSVITALVLIIFVSSQNSKSPDTTPNSAESSVQHTSVISLTPLQKQHAAKVAKQQATQAKLAADHQKAAQAKANADADRQEKEDERKQAQEEKQQQEFTQTHYQNEGLTFAYKSTHWAEDDSGIASYITGKVTNDSGSDLDYAEITFKEMDGENNQIGTARDNITHFSAGDTWKFKCIILDSNTKHIKFDELKTTPF